MKIECTPEEAAGLVVALQGRFDSDELRSTVDACLLEIFTKVRNHMKSSMNSPRHDTPQDTP
jgi:hypothetical protein